MSRFLCKGPGLAESRDFYVVAGDGKRRASLNASEREKLAKELGWGDDFFFNGRLKRLPQFFSSHKVTSLTSDLTTLYTC